LIVNVGPVHLEQLGSLEAVAAAKAELIDGLAAGSAIVLPANEPLLTPYRRKDLRTYTFGEGGDVELAQVRDDGLVLIRAGERCFALRPSFAQTYNLHNLLAAVAVARVLGIEPSESLDVSFSALRGERRYLPGGILLINDCYNANPMSMRAALEDLAATAERDRHARRVAVLGDMLELGDGEHGFHAELGREAQTAGVDLLVTVGPQAAAMSETFAGRIHLARDANEAAHLVPPLLQGGDLVLVKGSRAVGLELVCRALRNGDGG
jgi:UDP-N-acetylmuramoyl-tripeptide--D-alanyl-D-alanine ligase